MNPIKENSNYLEIDKDVIGSVARFTNSLDIENQIEKFRTFNPFCEEPHNSIR
jgi:hypothetical protein